MVLGRVLSFSWTPVVMVAGVVAGHSAHPYVNRIACKSGSVHGSHTREGCPEVMVCFKRLRVHLDVLFRTHT